MGPSRPGSASLEVPSDPSGRPRRRAASAGATRPSGDVQRFMAHVAIQEADEQGEVVMWGEHVTDEEYHGPAWGREQAD